MDHSSSLLTSLLSSFLKSVLYIATRMSFGSRKPSLITLLPESTQWLPATQNWRERYYNGLMSGLLFTFLNSSPPTLPFSLSLQPHFLSIFIFFKRKKKKGPRTASPTSSLRICDFDPFTGHTLLGVSLWHFIQSSALFSPWIALKDSSLMYQELNLSVFISQLCESSEDSSTSLPVSDSETLGSLIFLVSLLSVYPSAPLQRCKLHEGKTFSLHLFSFLLCTVYIEWCLAYGRFSINRRQWHPSPVLLPGISHGWRSLVGRSPWGH